MRQKSIWTSMVQAHLKNMHYGPINQVILVIGYLVALLQLVQKLGLNQSYLATTLSILTLQNIVGNQVVVCLGLCLAILYIIMLVFNYQKISWSSENKQKISNLKNIIRSSFVNYFGLALFTLCYFPVISAAINIVNSGNSTTSYFQVAAWINICMYACTFIIITKLNSLNAFVIQKNNGESHLGTFNILLGFNYFRAIFVFASCNIITKIGSILGYIIIISYLIYKSPIISYRYNTLKQVLIICSYVLAIYRVVQFVCQLGQLNPIFLSITLFVTVFGLMMIIKKRQKLIVQQQKGNQILKLKYLVYEIVSQKQKDIVNNHALAAFIMKHKKTCKSNSCNCSKILAFYTQNHQDLKQKQQVSQKVEIYWHQFIVNQVKDQFEIAKLRKTPESQIKNQINTLEDSFVLCAEILAFKLNKTNQAFLMLTNFLAILQKKQFQEIQFQGKYNFLTILMSEHNIKNQKTSSHANQYCLQYFQFHQYYEYILNSINKASRAAFQFWYQLKYYDPNQEKLITYLKEVDAEDLKIHKNYQKLRKISKSNLVHVQQKILDYQKTVLNIKRQSLSRIQQDQGQVQTSKQNYHMNMSKEASLFFDTSNTGICTHSLNSQTFGLIYTQNVIFKKLFARSDKIKKINDLIIDQFHVEHDKIISSFVNNQQINFSHEHAYIKIDKKCIKRFKVFSQLIPSLDQGLKLTSFFNCEVCQQDQKQPVVAINQKLQILYTNSEVFQNLLQTQSCEQSLVEKDIEIQNRPNNSDHPQGQSFNDIKQLIPNLNVRICQNYYVIQNYEIIGTESKIIFLQLKNIIQVNDLQAQQIRRADKKQQSNAISFLMSFTKRTLQFKSNFFNSQIFRQIVKNQQSEQLVYKLNKIQKVYKSSIGWNNQKFKKSVKISCAIFFTFSLLFCAIFIFFVISKVDFYHNQKDMLDSTSQINISIGSGLSNLREINVNSYLGKNLEYMIFMSNALFECKQIIRANLQSLSNLFVGKNTQITAQQILPQNTIKYFPVDMYVAISNYVISGLTTLYQKGPGKLNFSPMKSQMSIPYKATQCNFLQANTNGVFTILPSLFSKTKQVYETQIYTVITSLNNQVIIIPFMVIILVVLLYFTFVFKLQLHDTKSINFALSFINQEKAEHICQRLRLLQPYKNKQKQKQTQTKQCIQNENPSIDRSKQLEYTDNCIQTTQREFKIQQNISNNQQCELNSNIQQKQNSKSKKCITNQYNVSNNRQKLKFKVQTWWTRIGKTIAIFSFSLSFMIFATVDHFVINSNILKWYQFQNTFLYSEQILSYGYLYLLQLGPLQNNPYLAQDIMGSIDSYYESYRILKNMQEQFIQPESHYWMTMQLIEYNSICDNVGLFEKSTSYKVKLTKDQCQNLSYQVLMKGYRSLINYYLQSVRQICYKNQRTISYTHDQRIQYLQSPELEQIRRLRQYISQANNLLKRQFSKDFVAYLNSYKLRNVSLSILYLISFGIICYLYLMKPVLSQKIRKEMIVRSVMKLVSFQTLLRRKSFQEEALKGEDMFLIS